MVTRLRATPRREEFKATIAAIVADGEAPTAAAVAARLGITKQGATDQLRDLVELGELVYTPPRHATYRLPPDGERQREVERAFERLLAQNGMSSSSGSDKPG